MITNNFNFNGINSFLIDLNQNKEITPKKYEKKINSFLLNFNPNFKQISPENYQYENYANFEGLKYTWRCNGASETEFGKIENEFILMNLIIRTKQVASEKLYDFTTFVGIRSNGGWFKKSDSFFSFLSSNKAEERAGIFKTCRECDVETFFKDEKLKKEKQAEELGITNQEDVEVVENLKKIRDVSSEVLKTVIESSGNDKTVMTNTLVAIGKELMKGIKTDTSTYFKRTKEADQGGIKGQRLTHAFAIGENIHITPKAPVLGKGTFKSASNSINLNNMKKDLVRLKIKDGTAIPNALREANMLNQLQEAKNEEGSCLAPAYESMIQYEYEHPSTKNIESRLVMFQEKLEGNGNQLAKASAIEQLHAFINVGTGLAYLHQKGWVHMDNKPANILIVKDEYGRIMKAKLSDFGMATTIGGSFIGCNKKFASHEALARLVGNQVEVNPKMDSFEFGGIILTLLNVPLLENQTRLGDLNDTQIEAEINNTKISLQGTDEERRIRAAMLDVAGKLMKWDPNDRLSCSEAVAELKKIA